MGSQGGERDNLTWEQIQAALAELDRKEHSEREVRLEGVGSLIRGVAMSNALWLLLSLKRIRFEEDVATSWKEEHTKKGQI